VIAAVVFDLGSVLEVTDHAVFPAPFEARHGLAPGAVAASDVDGDPGLGEIAEAGVRGHWHGRLGLSDAQADDLMADYGRPYVGTLDQPLVDWFAVARWRGSRSTARSETRGEQLAARHHARRTVAALVTGEEGVQPVAAPRARQIVREVLVVVVDRVPHGVPSLP
jgi:hypothetical protein